MLEGSCTDYSEKNSSSIRKLPWLWEDGRARSSWCQLQSTIPQLSAKGRCKTGEKEKWKWTDRNGTEMPLIPNIKWWSHGEVEVAYKGGKLSSHEKWKECFTSTGWESRKCHNQILTHLQWSMSWRRSPMCTQVSPDNLDLYFYPISQSDCTSHLVNLFDCLFAKEKFFTWK